MPRDGGHGTGTLDQAAKILAEHPAVYAANIYTAAILGDEAAVRRFIRDDRTSATAKGGPHQWDALTHLCFSRYLRLDRARTAGFIGAATALLDAEADANTGWFEPGHQPRPQWESAIYGAAGVAQHPELTRLLLERGADPNDAETPYHAPETYDQATLRVLVESGKLDQQRMATMLLRKADWHDYEGIRYLLEHGASPNLLTHWGYTALHQALRRDNAVENIEVLLEHGADPAIPDQPGGRSAISMAVHRGRNDVLDLLKRRGTVLDFHGLERLIAACARDTTVEARSLAAREPRLLQELRNDGGRLLAEFAGNGNAGGVRQLLDLGVSPGALFEDGDGYWDVAPRSTALHVAAWRARHATVRLLIERGTPIDARDGKNRTALMLAVKACVDSCWMERRSPESVRTLLAAGASREGVGSPTGYDEIDRLLER